jgi:geranylgeranyl diphosphate synthase type II
MHPFQELIEKFNQDFDTSHFPAEPATLYEPSAYFLKIGGKRIRPVLCLLGNELFSFRSKSS